MIGAKKPSQNVTTTFASSAVPIQCVSDSQRPSRASEANSSPTAAIPRKPTSTIRRLQLPS